MMKNSLLVILDANIIIIAHKENYWPTLLNQYRLAIPSTVLHDEVFFFGTDEGANKAIRLQPYIASGKLQELTATVKELDAFRKSVHKNFLPSIDPGEEEALALLKSSAYQQYSFCTGDALAIQALAALGMSSRGVSLEKLLTSAGYQTKNLKHHFTESSLQKNLTKGFQEKHLWLSSIST